MQETVLTLQDDHDRGSAAGLDVNTGEPMDPVLAGVLDNYIVKVQMLHSAPVVTTQLLLVDEVMRAGVVNMRKCVSVSAHAAVNKQLPARKPQDGAFVGATPPEHGVPGGHLHAETRRGGCKRARPRHEYNMRI